MSGGQGRPFCSWEMPGVWGVAGRTMSAREAVLTLLGVLDILIRVSSHIGWLLHEWSQSESLCGARWALVACQPLGTRYPRTLQESSLAGPCAPGSDGVAVSLEFTTVGSFPRSFPRSVVTLGKRLEDRQKSFTGGRRKSCLGRTPTT